MKIKQYTWWPRYICSLKNATFKRLTITLKRTASQLPVQSSLRLPQWIPAPLLTWWEINQNQPRRGGHKLCALSLSITELGWSCLNKSHCAWMGRPLARYGVKTNFSKLHSQKMKPVIVPPGIQIQLQKPRWRWWRRRRRRRRQRFDVSVGVWV